MSVNWRCQRRATAFRCCVYVYVLHVFTCLYCINAYDQYTSEFRATASPRLSSSSKQRGAPAQTSSKRSHGNRDGNDDKWSFPCCRRGSTLPLPCVRWTPMVVFSFSCLSTGGERNDCLAQVRLRAATVCAYFCEAIVFHPIAMVDKADELLKKINIRSIIWVNC